jgi:hypothetical protein
LSLTFFFPRSFAKSNNLIHFDTSAASGVGLNEAFSHLATGNLLALLFCSVPKSLFLSDKYSEMLKRRTSGKPVADRNSKKGITIVDGPRPTKKGGGCC